MKRRKIFRWFHKQKSDLIFQQETYSSADIEKTWSTEWGGEIFFKTGSKHSKGVAILINPDSDISVQNRHSDSQGRPQQMIRDSFLLIFTLPTIFHIKTLSSQN